jgi:beta-lactamase class A
MRRPSQPLHQALPPAAAPDPSRRRFLATLGRAFGATLVGLLVPSAYASTRARSGAPKLQALLRAHVTSLRRERVVKPDEITAWSVYDFTTHRKLVSINEDLPLQAASMIKPFVALAFFYRMSARGSHLRYTPAIRRDMEMMIRDSSNAAANRLIDLLGGPARVQRVLKRSARGLLRQTRVVERIPPGGRAYRNVASAHDYSRFLYALWHDRLPHSEEIKRLMHLPNRDRIYTGAHALPRGTQIYDKTGSTAHLCGNMGIVVAKGRDGRDYPYTFIGIIQKRRRAGNYSGWVAGRGNVIRGASNLVYRWLREHHPLA